MAGKISELSALTSITTDDLFEVVDSPGTTPTSKKVTFDNLQKSVTVLGGVSGVSSQGDLRLPSNKIFYLGDETTDGSFRWYISGGNLLFETRVSGSWVERAQI